MLIVRLSSLARAIRSKGGALAGDRRGSTLVEMAVLGAVAMVVGVMAVSAVGSGVRDLYGSVASATAATPR